MISSILLKNIQSHKRTKLLLSKGINAIVGGSDKGKTAILRGLRWCLQNVPSGDRIKSNWGGESVVLLKTAEGNSIRRSRDKKNVYKVNKNILKAFGQDIPEEVNEAANVSSINIQTQHSPAYLLSNTAGQVAKELNHIVNLNDIDIALSNADKRVRAHNREIETLERSIAEQDEKIESFIDLDEFESRMKVLEKIVEKYEDTNYNIEILSKMIERLEELEEQLVDTPEIPDLGDLPEKIEKLKKIESKAEELESIGVNLEDAEMDLKDNAEALKSAEKKLKEEFPSICPLCGQNQIKERK